MSRGSSTSLAPGFRFHPTDEELVRYYLKRKVSGKPLRIDPISEVDVYKSEPWDLPAKSKLKSRDLEWYFFSMLDKKYRNGSKTNRATENGYWKTTGKDRPIRYYTRTVGMKKTLVYHSGRAPRGQRSNWVMHEYRLSDEELEKAGIAQESFVLCRIFQKSGPGPKNGEQYGAPLVEEEWEDDKVSFFSDDHGIAEDVILEDDIYEEANVLDQNIPVAIPLGALPETVFYGITSSENEQSGELNEIDHQEPENGESHQCGQSDENKYFSLPEQNQVDVKAVKREFASPSSVDEMNQNEFAGQSVIDELNLGNGSYLEDAAFMDANDNPLLGDEIYLTDLSSYSGGIDPDGFNVEDYLTFFDTDGEDMMLNNSTSTEQLQLPEVECGGDTEQKPEASELRPTPNGNDGASSSRQDKEPEHFKPDFKHAFFKQASHMLGSFPAPPAYASEYPVKGAAYHASSSIHVTAGMLRIRSLTLIGTELSIGKNGELNIVLSLGLSHGGGGNSVSGYNKTAPSSSVVSWSWALFLFLWVILLSVSAKIGVSVYSR